MSHLNDFNNYLKNVVLYGDKDTAAKNIDNAITSLSLRLIELTNLTAQRREKLEAWVNRKDRIVLLMDDDYGLNALQKQQIQLLVNLLLLRNELRAPAPKTETRICRQLNI